MEPTSRATRPDQAGLKRMDGQREWIRKLERSTTATVAECTGRKKAATAQTVYVVSATAGISGMDESNPRRFANANQTHAH